MRELERAEVLVKSINEFERLWKESSELGKDIAGVKQLRENLEQFKELIKKNSIQSHGFLDLDVAEGLDEFLSEEINLKSSQDPLSRQHLLDFLEKLYLEKIDE